MALKVELRPHERIIVGNCVITNTDQRARLLITGFKDKTQNAHVRRALDALLAQPAELLTRVTVVTKFKQAIANLPKSPSVV